MNKVIMIGRLTKDPELRYTNSGKAVANYTLAVDRDYKKEGQPDADFIRCVAYDKGGEFAGKYLKKGTKIAIVGHIQTGSYEKNGQKVFTTDIIVEHHEFCESKKQGGDIDSLAQYGNVTFTGEAGEDGELPF